MKLYQKEVFRESITEASTPVPQIVKKIPPCGVGSKGGQTGVVKNKFGPKGQKIFTVSILNGVRTEYKNQSACARALGVNQTVISKRKYTGRAVSGYYIRTK